MKRYTHANASLHAPEELKRKTAAPAPGAKKNRRSLWMAPVAAALA